MARSRKRNKRAKEAVYALIEKKLQASKEKKVKTIARPRTSMTELEQAIHERHNKQYI